MFLSHYVVKRGPAALQASTDTVQPGIFLVILQQACAYLLMPAACQLQTVPSRSLAVVGTAGYPAKVASLVL